MITLVYIKKKAFDFIPDWTMDLLSMLWYMLRHILTILFFLSFSMGAFITAITNQTVAEEIVKATSTLSQYQLTVFAIGTVYGVCLLTVFLMSLFFPNSLPVDYVVELAVFGLGIVLLSVSFGRAMSSLYPRLISETPYYRFVMVSGVVWGMFMLASLLLLISKFTLEAVSGEDGNN